MSAQINDVKTVLVTDFSKVPSGRYAKDGPDSGQIFRERYLAPAFKGAKRIVVRLEGAAGFPSSFLDEAFGGLVRIEGLSPQELHERLVVECSEDELHRYVSLIWRYIDRAEVPKGASN
jgi:hypothetical protein